MALARARSPSLLVRAAARLAGIDLTRVIHLADGELEHHGVDLLGQSYDTALGRRLSRPNDQVVTSYAAVFAAVRWREQAVTRPAIWLQQRRGGEWEDVGNVEDAEAHPALAALRRLNAATTFRQGFGGIERGKLTYGDHYWIKRRTRTLGVVTEFEVWSGAETRAVARTDRPWEPDHFERRLPDGRTVQVSPEDAVWFRHIVHPRNPMLSLTPIGAIRVQADTGLEAQRYTQRYFDQGVGFGGLVMPAGEEGLGAGEAARIRQEMELAWRGTDNAHRWHLLEANLKLLANPQSNRDLEFVALLKWGVIEVARVFELNPTTLKDFERATYSNVDQAHADDWETIQNQVDSTVEELNEFWVRPDFGDDFRLAARYDDIPALAQDQKAQAEIDEIRLRTGTRTRGELRERDGLDVLDGADVPDYKDRVEAVGGLVRAGYAPDESLAVMGLPSITHIGLPPVTVQASASPAAPRQSAARRLPPTEETPQTEDSPELVDAERRVGTTFERILRRELRAIIAHIEQQTGERDLPDGILQARTVLRRVLPDDAVETYKWDAWLDRYGGDVRRAIADVFEVGIVGAGLVETPLLSATKLAAAYARSRAGELLTLEGAMSVVETTRRAVRGAVAQAIREGQSIRQLKNELRALYEFSPARAETIARTETADAVGQGTRQAAQSQGRNEKRWRTARDERVDGGAVSGPCIDNAAQGWIPIDDDFSSGRKTVPAHPRCRCDVEYRTRRPGG